MPAGEKKRKRRREGKIKEIKEKKNTREKCIIIFLQREDLGNTLVKNSQHEMSE